jgi:O-acetyl-ADP-ribose deacetylase (regulator of RNase III)
VTINYVIGDATDPVGTGQRLIAHICNDEGKWGSGFVVALSRRDKVPEDSYRMWHRTHYSGGIPIELGQMQVTTYTDGVFVANMIAQRGVRHSPSAPPVIRYGALSSALSRVADYAHRGWSGPPTIHMPRIGCGLAGGTWDKVEPIITRTLIERDLNVTVYDLEES